MNDIRSHAYLLYILFMIEIIILIFYTVICEQLYYNRSCFLDLYSSFAVNWTFILHNIDNRNK